MFEWFKKPQSEELKTGLFPETSRVASLTRYCSTTVLPAVGLGVALTSFIGCQGFKRTEIHQDRIDRFSDHEPHLDHLYRPGLDVSRIGQPDWYQDSALNQRWYDPNKVRGQRPLPGYEHNPIHHHEPVEPRPIYRESLTLQKEKPATLQLVNRQSIERELFAEAKPHDLVLEGTDVVHSTSTGTTSTEITSPETQTSGAEVAYSPESHLADSETKLVNPVTDTHMFSTQVETEISNLEAQAPEEQKESLSSVDASQTQSVIQPVQNLMTTSTLDDDWQKIDVNNPTPPLPPKSTNSSKLAPRTATKIGFVETAEHTVSPQTQATAATQSKPEEASIPAKPFKPVVEEDGFVSQ